ncbi:MAG TPA: hypothetical protein VF974_04960 [Patescibacteria group bacterium]
MNEIELKNEETIIQKDFDIDSYLSKRSEFIDKVNRIMIEGKDYHVIQNKKSMGKSGAEKIAAIFGWQAMFLPDDDTIKMLGSEKGVLAYICKLQKGSHFIGEGRGARSLAQDKGDANKAIKMAAKSAFVDAVLRSSGLSDFYTQDLENMNHTEILKGSVDSNSVPTSEGRPKGVSAANKGKPMSDKQNKMIHALMKEKAVFTLGEIGIEKIANPTMEDASMIIKKLMDYKIEDKTIQIDKSDLPD